MRKKLKLSIWIAAGLLLLFGLAVAFRQTPVIVDVAVIRHGSLQVTVDDDGRTRVRERYTISAPIPGRLLRTPLDPGDLVAAGETVVAEFAPIAPELLDARSKAAARARLQSAKSALSEAQTRKAQSDAQVRLAASELARVRGLVAEKTKSKSDLETAERNEAHARLGSRAADFSAQVARYEVDVAKASLIEATPEEVGSKRAHAEHADGRPQGRLRLRSPIDGKVLRVFEESARALAAGTSILEIGNTAALEVVADYLSQDAVRVRPGMRVFVEGWGGEATDGGEQVLQGRVRVVEPGGFTKTSALGVEEQRVNIIVDPVGDHETWARFGDGYRVELRILLHEEQSVPIVPTGALFRQGDAWAVFVIEGDVAKARVVGVGRRNGLQARIRSGLSQGERVILYPSDLIADGTRVVARG